MATPSKAVGGGESTYLDTEIRVKRAEELLCDQHSGRQIVRTLCDQFEVVERTAYHYVRLAYDRLQADAANDRGIRKARARATWQTQYRRCLEAKDLSAANYALDRLMRLDGLFAPEKIEIGGTISVAVQMRAVMNILDADGLAALEIVLTQMEAARVRGELVEAIDDEAATLPEGDEAVAELLGRDGEPVPIPAKGRGRKAVAKPPT